MKVVSKKKYLPDKLETLQTLQKVFFPPENPSEISIKSGTFLFGWKHLDCTRTVIFSGCMQYFQKIHNFFYEIQSVWKVLKL